MKSKKSDEKIIQLNRNQAEKVVEFIKETFKGFDVESEGNSEDGRVTLFIEQLAKGSKQFSLIGVEVKATIISEYEDYYSLRGDGDW
jgi:hypothetical protein